MFTGIIEAVGTLQKTFQADGEWRFEIAVGDLNVSDVSLGDSIAVSGCCLTVVSKSSNSFSADVSNETMRCTALGELSNGDRVNLEKTCYQQCLDNSWKQHMNMIRSHSLQSCVL